MSTYLFVLGKDPKLSAAELWMRYGRLDFAWTSKEVVGIDLDRAFDQAEFNQLGGVIKVAMQIKSVSRGDLVAGLASVLSFHFTGTKLDYGISVYGWPEKQLRPLLLDLKKRLRNEDVKSRFINNHFLNISAAQYKSIREKGIELVVVKQKDQFLIGEVRGVQEKPHRQRERHRKVIQKR